MKMLSFEEGMLGFGGEMLGIMIKILGLGGKMGFSVKMLIKVGEISGFG